jgi:hypothetical protein
MMWTIGDARYPPEDLGLRKRKADTPLRRNVSNLMSIRRMPTGDEATGARQFFTCWGYSAWLYFGPAVAERLWRAG